MTDFTETDRPVPVPGFEVVPVGSWRKFARVINSKIGEIHSGDFVFRGQRDSTWQLTASLDRRYPNLSPTRRKALVEQLSKSFLDLADRAELDLRFRKSEMERAVMLGQHHGLATRMLDWTESRYVAAFFAYAALSSRYDSSLTAESAPGDHCVSVFALDLRSPVLNNDEGLTALRASGAQNERMRRQRGLFTVNQTSYTAIEGYVQYYCDRFADELTRTPLYRFDLPVHEVRVALRDLQEMRISHDELFPGLDGVARESMLREWLNNAG
jgi:hypothetical protein